MATEYVAKYRHGDREVLDYSIDWKRVLAVDGDAILQSEWFAESGTPTIGDGSNGAPAHSHASGVATAWIVEGTVNHVYGLTNRITTAFGRRHEASVEITVVDK